MSVSRNIGVPLRLRGDSKRSRAERARELLSLVNIDLDIYYDRFPNELSGGEQQRVGV